MRSNEKIRELYIRNKWIILAFIAPIFYITSFYNVNLKYLVTLGVVFFIYCLLGYKIIYSRHKTRSIFIRLMPYIDATFCSLAVYLRGGFRTDTYMIFILLMAIYPIFENVARCFKICIFSIILYSISCLYYVNVLTTFYWDIFTIRLTFFPITLLVSIYFNKKISFLRNSLAEEMLNARKDALTGLWNRKMMKEVVNRLSHECKINKEKTYGILLVDLDNFKSINDTYGHDKGDIVLTNVAHCLSQNISDQDITFRLGGDEFLVLIKDCDEPKLKQYADRIRNSISRLRFNFGNSLYCVTVSIGGSLSEEGDFDEMFKLSDERLYYGKTSGKNIGVTC